MIKHLCKLVWNRKRVNFLITLEIFLSFLVVFAVVVLAVYYIDNYRQPLGFDYRNVWHVKVDRIELSGSAEKDSRQRHIDKMKRVIAAAREFPEVVIAAGGHYTPYMTGNWVNCNGNDGRNVCYWGNSVGDEYKDLFGIKIIRGRWFGKEDDGANYRPLVINRRLALERFGALDAVGKKIVEKKAEDKDSIDEVVVGVIDDFRKNGEFAELYGYAFSRNNMDRPDDRPWRVLAVKVAPGTTADFEEKLLKRLQAEADDWSFTIKPLDQMRDEMHRKSIVPMMALAVVAGFLMIMVGLGLTGVLWQSVTQRTKEIGLRRAKGATKKRIYNQILGELLLIATFGLLAGVLVVVQFPLLDYLGFASKKVYFYSMLISLVLIYLLAIVCGLYPSRLATKVQPAEALHYE